MWSVKSVRSCRLGLLSPKNILIDAAGAEKEIV